MTLSSESNFISKHDSLQIQLTISFSLLVFGSVLDNTKQQKKILIIVETLIAIMFFVFAVIVLCKNNIEKFTKDFFSKEEI